jgi:two-component system, OmpR family, sensor histidine kinase VicK
MDSGRGMSKELQGKLFQQFVRDEKTKREVQGTGLGLFIAKQIVEAHKGSISTFSAGEGMGSAFIVRLGKG